MTCPDGSVYNGEWEDGKRHGQGIYRYINGDYYDGEWKDGRKHGKGFYLFANQGIMYDGKDMSSSSSAPLVVGAQDR